LRLLEEGCGFGGEFFDGLFRLFGFETAVCSAKDIFVS
jgi:hypothetical protein